MTYVTMIRNEELLDKIQTMLENYEDDTTERGRKIASDFRNMRCQCFGFNYGKLEPAYDYFGCVSYTQISEAKGFREYIRKEYSIDGEIQIIDNENERNRLMDRNA